MRQYSESTLMGMTKKELVQEVLIAYHNQNAAEATVRQQAVNMMDWEPVRHGRWEAIGADKRGRGGIFRCSSCNKTYHLGGMGNGCSRMSENEEAVMQSAH